MRNLIESAGFRFSTIEESGDVALFVAGLFPDASRACPELDPACALDTHGRGIAMARMMSFDELEFLGNGDTVRAGVLLDRT